MVAPGVSLTLDEFHETSEVLGSFMVTIYVLGYAVGPLFLGPMSELYGRYPTVISSTWFFNAFILGSGLAPNMTSLIIMRFLAGIGGSGVMTIAPAIVADLYPVQQRATATSLIILAQCVGPARRLISEIFDGVAHDPDSVSSWAYHRRLHLPGLGMALGTYSQAQYLVTARR
jgi:MFS family permease